MTPVTPTLAAANCTHCGAAQQVDPMRDAAICVSCGAPFVVAKALQTTGIRLYSPGGGAVADTYDFEIVNGVLIAYKGRAAAADIPFNVRYVGAAAFLGNTGLRRVSVPASVRMIRNDAFRGCTSLERAEIADGVTEIWSGAFAGCTALKSVNIPASVTNLGSGAFMNCASLVTCVVPESVVTQGVDVFAGTPVEAARLEREQVWREQGLCHFCGGNLTRILHRCKVCGKMN
jgi:hypothetical protein